MKRFMLYATLALLISDAGVASFFGNQQPCNLDVPANATENHDNQIAVQADLSKFATLPVTAGWTSAFKGSTELVFQKVPDKDMRCRLLLQVIICAINKKVNQQTVSELTAAMPAACGPQVDAFKLGNKAGGKLK